MQIGLRYIPAGMPTVRGRRGKRGPAFCRKCLTMFLPRLCAGLLRVRWGSSSAMSQGRRLKTVDRLGDSVNRRNVSAPTQCTL